MNYNISIMYVILQHPWRNHSFSKRIMHSPMDPVEQLSMEDHLAPALNVSSSFVTQHSLPKKNTWSDMFNLTPTNPPESGMLPATCNMYQLHETRIPASDVMLDLVPQTKDPENW